MNITSIESNYNLRVKSVERINIGSCNHASTVYASEQKFFQKIYLQQPIAQIEKIIKVHEFLAKQGFPVAVPLRNRNGAYISMTTTQSPYTLFTYLSGSPKKSFSVENLRDVGTMLADVHLALDKMQYLDAFIDEDKDYNSTEWYDANIKFLEQLNESESRILRTEYATLQPQASTSNLDSLPRALLHWDFSYLNILFDKDRITAITDFESLKYDARIYDLAIATVGFCLVNERLEREGMKHLLESYSSKSQLTESELKIFPYLLKLMAWDLWCSTYVFGQNYARDLSKLSKHYKEAYLNIKNDKIL